jgi:hypothetical protein
MRRPSPLFGQLGEPYSSDYFAPSRLTGYLERHDRTHQAHHGGIVLRFAEELLE